MWRLVDGGFGSGRFSEAADLLLEIRTFCMEKWYVFHEVDVRAFVTDVERRLTNVRRGVVIHSTMRSGRFFERRWTRNRCGQTCRSPLLPNGERFESRRADGVWRPVILVIVRNWKTAGWKAPAPD
ncbi:hypothetical protein C6I21_09100 [Alkalicoccus urumqiensis]|uniref:Uncharacterized protein n=1 Tax=Alkalicoccus urumqiensis TaxID=1548213 RepID=A0A2P6MHA5_ALKUR|nr:hypothetical protein C6I21_09100 [Alkalicoccus urumqiensis]